MIKNKYLNNLDILVEYTKKGSGKMGNYYQPEIECASQEQIREWQNERLVKTVHHVYKNVPYYRNLMDQKGVTPDDIRSVEDLHKLPNCSQSRKTRKTIS